MDPSWVNCSIYSLSKFEYPGISLSLIIVKKKFILKHGFAFSSNINCWVLRWDEFGVKVVEIYHFIANYIINGKFNLVIRFYNTRYQRDFS